jgi:hypothetical protein
MVPAAGDYSSLIARDEVYQFTLHEAGATVSQDEQSAVCLPSVRDIILNGGHAEPVIGRAFARPGGFA